MEQEKKSSQKQSQSLPSYAMNCYRLPVGLCEDLQQLCAVSGRLERYYKEAFDGRLVVVKTLMYGKIAGDQILTSDSIYTSTKRSSKKGFFEYKRLYGRHGICPLCAAGAENNVHLFTQCGYAHEVLAEAATPIPQMGVTDFKIGG
ncbi:hypothetical protein ACLB2K_001954 [Fragaria x ananassa]